MKWILLIIFSLCTVEGFSQNELPVVQFTDPFSGRIMKVRHNLNLRMKEPYFTTMKELLEDNKQPNQ